MRINNFFNRIIRGSDKSHEDHSNAIKGLSKELDNIKTSLGRLHSNAQRFPVEIKEISEYEFRVYSQWGDDGIIQFLVNYLDIKDKRFVEFGVENYKECNTRFLLVNNNWSGLVMDGSSENVKQIQSEDIYWQYNLTARAEFVTAENINELLESNGFTGEIGLLHIDIDGNDYWVWKAVQIVNPVIVIVEYNSIFGFDKPWTIPYKADFFRTDFDKSNLYFGASVLSFCDLAREKGYIFIGCNSNGNNAYFIRKDKQKELREKSPEEGFVLSQFSESRNASGQLTFIRGEKRLEIVKGLPVFNTRTNVLENI